MKQQRYFITSSGTGVGKTLITAALSYQLRKAGRHPLALKPIISGYDEKDSQSDTHILLQAQGLPVVKVQAETISPWRFAAPLSPNMAAAKDGLRLSFDKIIDFCQQDYAHNDVVLIEGVGGAMVPLNERRHSLHWMKALNYPAIVVVGSYLGAISHALTTITTLQQAGIKLHAIIVSESENSDVDLQETIETMVNFVPNVPFVALPRLQPEAGKALWQQVPDLLKLIK